MPICSRNDGVLVRYPFPDLSGAKVRPAVIVSVPHPSQDVFVVPLTSRTHGLFPGEYVLADWRAAGLHVPTTVKRGLYTVATNLVLQSVGKLSLQDAQSLTSSLKSWLGV